MGRFKALDQGRVGFKLAATPLGVMLAASLPIGASANPFGLPATGPIVAQITSIAAGGGLHVANVAAGQLDTTPRPAAGTVGMAAATPAENDTPILRYHIDVKNEVGQQTTFWAFLEHPGDGR